MWIKIYLFLLLALIVRLSFFSSPLYATTIYTSDMLINQSNQLDGKAIYFKGEVVGDILRRGNFCWINVYDGSQAIGIYCRTEMVKYIKFVGDYKHTGDTLEIRGIFHKSCKQHGGELDIHAKQIRIIKTGAKREHPLSKPRLYLAILLLLCISLVLWLYIYLKRLPQKTI